MSRPRRPLPPLSPADLERYALRYVERYATTRGRLADYLRRKIRERGWGEGPDPDPAALAQRMADLGYVDDLAYAESKAGAMGRRGLGARRVNDALRVAGITAEDAESVAPAIAAEAARSALAFARRKRLGPFAAAPAERPQRDKQLAAMLRAGHSFALSRRILLMAPGEDIEMLVASETD